MPCQTKLKSSVNIATLAQCVEELLLNSVDAKASCISIRINLSNYFVQVVDNGIGISQKEMLKIGQRSAYKQSYNSSCHILTHCFDFHLLASCNTSLGLLYTSYYFIYLFGKNILIFCFRHSTSKPLPSLISGKPNSDANLYGHRGEALASIIQLSESVEIVSRNEKSSNDTYSKTFRDGLGTYM